MVGYKKSNIRYVFCNKQFKTFLEGQMSKVIFFCTVVILNKCDCKSLVQVICNSFLRNNDIIGI